MASPLQQKILHLVTFYLVLQKTLSSEMKIHSGEYCQSEYFQPRCLKNEVILMNSAIYGRMRIGRCIKDKEVDAFGDDPRYLGCSTDVVSVLDRKCTGKTECDVRIIDISDENIQPCFPGLIVYLEASYSCISIVDEKRSCSVTASKETIHILVSSGSLNKCGNPSQPWIVDAPTGQTLNISIFDMNSSESGHDASQQRGLHDCDNYGLIVDKTRKRNVTICGRTATRYTALYMSSGNVVEIFVNMPYLKEDNEDGRQFILKFEAIGCSDIIPPEDTWLKRNNDSIVIGCYSSRQSWQFRCKDGKWIGVLGNCTHDNLARGSFIESNLKTEISTDEQVLAIVAISGCTLAICLAIACVGAVCLRRFYGKARKKHEYKTLNSHINSVTRQRVEQRLPSGDTTDLTRTEVNGIATQQLPTYSVYVGGGGSRFNEDAVSVDNTTRCSQD